MAEATDYSDIVGGTIDEVKEAVEERDLDPEQVLEAEKENKDRVTLVDWLEEKIDDADGTAPYTADGTAPYTDGEEENTGTVTLETSSVPGAIGDLASRTFAAGIIVGLIAAFALFSTGVISTDGGLSPSAAGDQIETYFSQNAEQIPLEGVTVQSVERLPGSDLYRLDMVLSASFLNRTVEQNQTAVISSNARYMFLAEPIDTNRPLAEQIGTTGQQPPQQ